MLCITPPELTHLLTTSLNSLPSISIPLPSCPSNHHSIVILNVCSKKKKGNSNSPINYSQKSLAYLESINKVY